MAIADWNKQVQNLGQTVYKNAQMPTQQMGSSTPTNNFLGSNFDFLQNNLKQSIGGNNPIFDTLFGNAQRRIGASTDRNIQDIKEMGAQSGFRGAGGNLINEAYKGEKEALSGISDNLALQEMNYQQNAINQLLGLNQFEGGQNFGAFQSDRQNSQFNQSQAQQWKMFQEQMNFQKDQANTDFWDVLSGIFGGVAGGFGGALGGNAASKWL